MRIAGRARMDLAPENERQGEQHFATQAGVLPGNAQIVAPHVEVRNATGGIDDAGADVLDRHAVPGEVDDQVDVEIHACGDARAVDAGNGCCQRVKAVAEHGVADSKR